MRRLPMTQCMKDAELHTDVTISHIDGLDLKHNLPSEEVHKRALAARNLYGKAQMALTFWIVEMDERKLYKEYSCSNIFQYATRYLNLGEHTIAEILRTGKALAQLPLLSEALEKGQISSSHVREISRVATEETEQFFAVAGIHCAGSLLVLCSGCHALVHEGKLSVKGEAPHKLIWIDGNGRAI
jgi:hypothetical protein